MNYRKTPQSTTQEAPAMLFMKRLTRSRIDLIKPDLKQRVELKLQVQKQNFDKHTISKDFQTKDRVWARDNWGNGKMDSWRSGRPSILSCRCAGRSLEKTC